MAVSSLEDNAYDYLFKIVIIGDANVGKSSLINRFCYKSFTDKCSTTVGVDFLIYDLEIGKDNQKLKVKLHLWDTAGEEKYKSLTSVYYRNAHAVIIVFDLTRPETFEHIPEWLRNITEHCGDEVHSILVGNKCDLENQVDDTDIDVMLFYYYSVFDIRTNNHCGGGIFEHWLQNLAYLHNLHFIETSAKTSANVEETFHRLAKDLVESYDQLLSLPSLNPGPNSLWLHYQEAQNKTPQGYCCSYM